MKKLKSPAIHRTPKYRAKASYNGMLARCLNRNGKNPSYASVELRISLEEWMSWAVPIYEKCMKEFPDDTPTVARNGDSGHYEFGNVSVVPWRKNRDEQGARGVARVQPDGTKRCTTCKLFKLAEKAFSKKRGTPDGYAYHCKDCARGYYEKSVSGPLV
jgi:hypothetical protein